MVAEAEVQEQRTQLHTTKHMATQTTMSALNFGCNQQQAIINLLKEVDERSKHISTVMRETIKRNQRYAVAHRVVSDATKYELNNVIYRVKHEEQRLQELWGNIILDPFFILRVKSLQCQLEVKRTQLYVFLEELEAVRTTSPDRALPRIAKLVIYSQPIGCFLMPNKRLQCNRYEVNLHTGMSSRALLLASPDFKYTLVCPDSSASAQIDRYNQCGNHCHEVGVGNISLGITSGCAKSTAAIQVHLPLPNSEPVSSEVSGPFVATIHDEDTWMNNYRDMVKAKLFREQAAVSFAHAVNDIHYHTLVATGQDAYTPVRGLTPQELASLANNSNPTVFTQADFDSLWRWFGPCLKVLHFNPLIRDMWEAGLICGFMSRASAKQHLKNRLIPGTFLIYFADKHPAALDIAFVGYADVDFYIVPEANLSVTAKQSLPFILWHFPQLQTMLKVTSTANGVHYDAILIRDALRPMVYTSDVDEEDSLCW